MKKHLLRAARTVFVAGISLFILAVLTAGASFFLWRQGVIQTWAETALVRVYLEKIHDQLPFEVEQAQVKKDWSELLVGQLNSLSLTLKKDDWRIRLAGPLSFPKANLTTLKQIWRKLRGGAPIPGDQTFRVDYYPKVTLEKIGKPKTPPLSLHLWAIAAPELNEIWEAGLETTGDSTNRSWKWQGLALEKPSVFLHWASGTFDADIGAASASFSMNGSPSTKDSSSDRALSLASPHISARFPLVLQPFATGPKLQAHVSAKSGEILWGERYFSAAGPWLDSELIAEISTPNSASVKLRIAPRARGPSAHSPLEIRAQLPSVNPLRVARVEWSLKSLPLADALPALIEATSSAGAPWSGLSALNGIEIKQGTLNLEGQARFDLRKPGPVQIESRTSLDDVSFLWPSKQLAVNALHLSLPFSTRKGIEGELAIGRFGFRKLRGKLKPIRLSAEPSRAPNSYAIRIGEKGRRIPLDIDGLLLRVDSPAGQASRGNEGEWSYQINTSLDLENVSIDRILAPLCVSRPDSNLPPVVARAHFPNIEITPDGIDLTGFARAELFGGFIEVDEMGVYDLFSEVPEVDFNLAMEGIRLDPLGSWLNFGQMDGVMTGHAKNVVFQSWLPTQYDFLLQVKPLRHSLVVFSPEAMRNFARLFAEEGIDQLPGFAQWLAFGWPSHLLGGYDIDYAGVHIRSDSGMIRLETLDPQVTTSSERNFTSVGNQKHFILYGRRFKMPLRSPHYPLIMDAEAMGNFVHRKMLQISQISKTEETNREKSSNENRISSPAGLEGDSLPASCVPSDLDHL